MAFLCHVCGESVAFGDKVCPRCKEPLDAQSVFKSWWEKLGFKLKRATAVHCPTCNAIGSLQFGYCVKCGCNFTIGSALAPLLRGPRRFWDRLVTNASPVAKRRFQLLYFFFSSAAFLTLLTVFEKLQPGKWLGTSLLVLIFLTFFLLLFFWLIPRHLLVLVARRTTRLVKLSLVANYFTLLLLIQLAVSTWVEKAVIVASQIVISIIAFYLLLEFVWPVWNALAESFRQAAGAQDFDPSAYQGRRAYSDDGRRRR
jgi:hypothetical protein